MPHYQNRKHVPAVLVDPVGALCARSLWTGLGTAALGLAPGCQLRQTRAEARRGGGGAQAGGNSPLLMAHRPELSSFSGNDVGQSDTGSGVGKSESQIRFPEERKKKIFCCDFANLAFAATAPTR